MNQEVILSIELGSSFIFPRGLAAKPLPKTDELPLKMG